MKRAAFLILLCLALTSCVGCYQRVVAPEVEYDQKQVDVLRSEIDKLEWE